MKILVDPEIFFFGRCGMVRYYSRLCQELEKRGHTVSLPLVRSNSDFIEGRWQGTSWLGSLPMGRKILNKVDVASKKWYFKELAAGNYDVVLITSPVFEDDFLKHLPAHKPYVMVVHDTMRCVLGPDGLFDPSGSNADRLAYLIRRASKAICISDATLQDSVLLTMADREKMCVIHTGNLMELSTKPVTVPSIPDKYLLFVGDRTGRKNFRFFLSSIAQYLQVQPDLYVVCTGKTNVWEEDLLVNLHVKDRVLFVDAPDAVLQHLYQNAVALVYPSLYEGFGLPALEAMALGCPVITSTCCALAEVGGDAVFYVEPANAASILQGVKQVVENKEVQQEMRQKGLKQAQKFTVANMVKAFEDVFEEVTQKKELIAS